MKYSNIQLEVDPHIHTIVSGHSWSTLSDYVEQSRLIGVKGFCITEHGPKTPSAAAPEFTPQAQRMLPETTKGIRMFKGLEANILDFNGNLDVRNKFLNLLEFCIASIHSFCLKGGTSDQNTDAYAYVLKNPYIDMIGHPDDPRVPCSLETLVLETKKQNKIIELNNKSLTPHRESSENTYAMMKLCKKHDVRICVSSDSHWHEMLGDFALSMHLLEEIDFPPELIVNYSLERFQQYVDERKARF